MRCYLSHERVWAGGERQHPVGLPIHGTRQEGFGSNGRSQLAKRWLRFSSTQLGGRWQLVASIGTSLQRRGVVARGRDVRASQ
jgi:hypothetical protein